MSKKPKRKLGRNLQVICQIADDFYGGMKEMFEAHGWSEPGNLMLPHVSRLVVEKYGSTQEFAKSHPSTDNIFDRGYNVLLTSFSCMGVFNLASQCGRSPCRKSLI